MAFTDLQDRGRSRVGLRGPTLSMELGAAREILAEVFKVWLQEVDEMIGSRFEVDGFSES